MARPIFVNFLKSVENDKEIGLDLTKRFKRVSGIERIEMDCSHYEYNGDEESELSIDSTFTNDDMNSDFGNEFQ
jgi:hypothetical protein